MRPSVCLWEDQGTQDFKTLRLVSYVSASGGHGKCASTVANLITDA